MSTIRGLKYRRCEPEKSDFGLLTNRCRGDGSNDGIILVEGPEYWKIGGATISNVLLFEIHRGMKALFLWGMSFE